MPGRAGAGDGEVDHLRGKDHRACCHSWIIDIFLFIEVPFPCQGN
jgi:hypothetical protein